MKLHSDCLLMTFKYIVSKMIQRLTQLFQNYSHWTETEWTLSLSGWPLFTDVIMTHFKVLHSTGSSSVFSVIYTFFVKSLGAMQLFAMILILWHDQTTLNLVTRAGRLSLLTVQPLGINTSMTAMLLDVSFDKTMKWEQTVTCMWLESDTCNFK